MLGSLLLLSNMAPAFAGNPSSFAPVTQPIGIAASSLFLFVTQLAPGTSPSQVLSVDSFGVSRVFATLFTNTAGAEEYIAISPGLGGFPGNFIYVTQGTRIVQVPPFTGSPVTVFATIPSLPASHNGITFDHVGTFGFDMIIVAGNTPPTGEVWKVDSAGTKTLIATVPGTPILESPEVAPMSFAPYGGQIIAASEDAGGGTVFAISNTGTVSTVTTWPTAEAIRFIPPKTCSFGTTGASFFDTQYSLNEIIKFPQTDFAGLGGSALVTSESAGTIGLLTSSGGSIVSSTFQTGLQQQEGSAFVDCSVPGIVGGFLHPINKVEVLSVMLMDTVAGYWWIFAVVVAMVAALLGLRKLKPSRTNRT
jgi:hypothetical protein